MGARANGLGYASSCLEDEWSLFNNIAGLTKINTANAAFSYHASPSLPGFNRMASVFAMPVRSGVAGLGVFRFGDDLYNEQILTAGFANTFGLASLGFKVNYIQYHAEGFGNTRALTLSIGGIAALTPQFTVGAHILNINQPRIAGTDNERLPTALFLGLGFKPSEKVFVTGELSKDLEYDLIWKSGIEYSLNKKISARTGFNIHPQAVFFGVGMKPKKFILDYTFQYNTDLSSSHQATVAYKFKSK